MNKLILFSVFFFSFTLPSFAQNVVGSTSDWRPLEGVSVLTGLPNAVGNTPQQAFENAIMFCGKFIDSAKRQGYRVLAARGRITMQQGNYFYQAACDLQVIK